jgi:hypothetical protein
MTAITVFPCSKSSSRYYLEALHSRSIRGIVALIKLPSDYGPQTYLRLSPSSK